MGRPDQVVSGNSRLRGVSQRANGCARIFVGGGRLDRCRESLITKLLESQFEARPRLEQRRPECRLELVEMPPNTRAATSDASYSGELRLATTPRHQSHVSNLTADMNSVVVKSGVATAFLFELRSSKLLRQRTRWPEPTVVSA